MGLKRVEGNILHAKLGVDQCVLRQDKRKGTRVAISCFRRAWYIKLQIRKNVSIFEGTRNFIIDSTKLTNECRYLDYVWSENFFVLTWCKLDSSVYIFESFTFGHYYFTSVHTILRSAIGFVITFPFSVLYLLWTWNMKRKNIWWIFEWAFFVEKKLNTVLFFF